MKSDILEFVDLVTARLQELTRVVEIQNENQAKLLERIEILELRLDIKDPTE